MKQPGWIFSGFAVVIGGLAGCAPKSPAVNPPVKPQISQKIPSGESQQTNTTDVTLKTSDGWSIVGKMYLPKGDSKGGVILLHQRGGTGDDWKPLCASLQEAGYAALAIDQRGAGKSTTGPGTVGTEAPWKTSGDIAAAVKSMKSYGNITLHSFYSITLVGASYGANNALIYAAAHPEQINSVVLLSPGENYHGLEALPAAQKYAGTLLIMNDHGDTVAGDGPSKINTSATQSKHKFIEYEGDGHGTELLRSQSIIDILDFLKSSM